MNLKEIAKHSDLYGADVILTALKLNFSHVSFTKNGRTIPKQGSETRKTKYINPVKGMKISGFIFHKNGCVTIKTTSPQNTGTQYFQFLNL